VASQVATVNPEATGNLNVNLPAPTGAAQGPRPGGDAAHAQSAARQAALLDDARELPKLTEAKHNTESPWHSVVTSSRALTAAGARPRPLASSGREAQKGASVTRSESAHAGERIRVSSGGGHASDGGSAGGAGGSAHAPLWQIASQPVLHAHRRARTYYAHASIHARTSSHMHTCAVHSNHAALSERTIWRRPGSLAASGSGELGPA
jgi:hypothetical protein